MHQNRAFAVLAKAIGRAGRLHFKESLIVSPCTFMRWYRDLCAAKYD